MADRVPGAPPDDKTEILDYKTAEIEQENKKIEIGYIGRYLGAGREKNLNIAALALGLFILFLFFLVLKGIAVNSNVFTLTFSVISTLIGFIVGSGSRGLSEPPEG